MASTPINLTLPQPTTTKSNKKSSNLPSNSSNFGSCHHVRSASKKPSFINSYKVLFEKLINASNFSLIYDEFKCFTNNCGNRKNLHACLSCVFVGCRNATIPAHKTCIHSHFTSNQGHYLFIELNYGQIYCGHCKDYVFNDTFDSIAKDFLFKKINNNNIVSPQKPVKEPTDKSNFTIPSTAFLSYKTLNTQAANKDLTNLLNKKVLIQPQPLVEGKKRKKSPVELAHQHHHHNHHQLNENCNGSNGPGHGNGSSKSPTPVLAPLGAKRLIVQKSSYIGLRGLVNLGNTCFMSTIIQALCHTPTLRNFFLSEKYIGLCNHATESNPFSDKCIVCEMSKIFQNFYSGKTSPFCLDRLLYLVWTQARHLAGYEQQDAHEFQIALLDLMHQQLAPRSNTPTNRALWDPPMTMIDRIFTGRLQSDVICNRCGNVSTSVDPFSDISLDIETRSCTSSNHGSTTNTNHHSSSSDRDHNDPLKSYTLLQCLNEFTKKEELGPACKIDCDNCERQQESTKQMSINRIPIVVCLHFKRFEQSHIGNGRKISNFVSFPEELNMRDFMTHNINVNGINGVAGSSRGDKSKQNVNINDRKRKSDQSANESKNTLKYRYTLYAVVTHSGNLQAGHYTCFIKHTGDWFYCDDHIIKKVSSREVLKTEAYLLFYHKKYLEYEQ